MRRTRQRLARKLVRIRTLEEGAEQASAQAARHELEVAREAEAASRARAAEVHDQLGRRARKGLAGPSVAAYAELLEATRRTITPTVAARETAEKRECAATAALLAAVRHRQAAEKLAERAADELAREAARREQRTLDEIATQRARPPAGAQPRLSSREGRETRCGDFPSGNV